MPRNRSKKGKSASSKTNASSGGGQRVVAGASQSLSQEPDGTQVDEISNIQPILDDVLIQPGPSSAMVDSFTTNAAALYDELDSFRQRWRRELEVTTKRADISESGPDAAKTTQTNDSSRQKPSRSALSEVTENANQKSKFGNSAKNLEETTSDDSYLEAKKLFLMAVDMEQEDMHHESILYYKKAMHLYPDIEKAIFREQCEASAKAAKENVNPSYELKQSEQEILPDNQENKIDLHGKIRTSHQEACKNSWYNFCRPRKNIPGVVHLSDLPQELIMQIFRYIVGEELDLASLEMAGMVCRGFFLLSRNQSLWRNICSRVWGQDEISNWESSRLSEAKTTDIAGVQQIDWRRMFLERPRVNYDGVYISRTRYIRQGDVGFQDITYRPFHVVRYYRYLRFFPDGRVLILTTNEEPDKIIPIFRHALHAKQFSPELSVLEGTFEFIGANQLVIMAEKDYRLALVNQSQRRQMQPHWARQTPLSQKFNFKFELKTLESKPYRNNILKWMEYAISTRMETSQETSTFDLSPDTFPNLAFCRVKKFNLRLTGPLASQ